MPEFRNILLPFSDRLSLEKMIAKTRKPVIFPFYHLVSDRPPPHIRQLYRVKSLASFRSDLEALLRYFEPASPEILFSGFPEDIRKPSFILSFDDGLQEITEYVVPLLEKKGINAIFFLNNSFIGNRDLFFRYKISLLADKLLREPPSPSAIDALASVLGLTGKGERAIKNALMNTDERETVRIDQIAQLLEIDFNRYLADSRPYMDEKQIGEIVGKGFYIGAHSFNHLSFGRLGKAEQHDEIVRSVSDIKDRFGINYSLFSFPYTDTGVGRDVFLRLYDQHHPLLDASFGTSGLKQPEAYPHYQRIPMEKSSAGAEKYLKTEYFYYLLKSVAGFNRIRRGWQR